MEIKYDIPEQTRLELLKTVQDMFPANNIMKTAVQKQWNIKYDYDEFGQPMWGGGHGGEE